MMWGVSSVRTLCREASAAGSEYLALTDTNGLYGLINFLEAARHYGIRPIVGAHLQNDDYGHFILQNRTKHSGPRTQGTGRRAQIVILAKTPRGYELLTELLTQRHLDEEFSLLQSFPAAPEDLAVLVSDPDLIEALRSRADCWVEIVPGPAGRQALKLARSLGIPPIATNAVYFAHSEDYPLHRLVRAIDLNRTLSTLPPEEVVQPGQWLKTGEDMARHLPDCLEALANTMKLARKCHTAWDHFRLIFPHYKDQADDHLALLMEACRKGIDWRYGKTNAAIEKRLAEELELIHVKGYVDYFLVVADIVRRRPIHCGRGSAAASLVSYLLGITHVDPIRHNLLFGRFLNPQRKDPPDIDVDFPWDERDALHEELRGHYGAERMAAVANHVGFGARAAVREVAKVYGVPAAEIKEVTRRMSFWTDPEDIARRVETHPKFRGHSLDPPWPEIMEWAMRLESLPRHLATHCGGVILAPDRVSRYVPVERSAKGAHIIQWEKDQSETAGLVKIDLLGNRSLAVIRDTLTAIQKNTGKVIDYATLNPIDDPATLDLLSRGDTMGVFYVESPAMRQLQKRTRRGDFEHLVIHSSIIRPAANRYILEYIRRLHGTSYKPLHPSVKELLAETYGILVYQEDVVRVAMALAGFSWAEADGLRKVISKKSPEQLSDYRKRFIDGCRPRDIAEDVVKTVWDMFISFSGYSFCKPHSASYALVSFKSAYLKTHYPAEFMAAVISNGGGYYSTLAYISETRRMGIAVLGPDINESDWGYLGQGRTIRMGFQQLQDIRKDVLQAIWDERKQNGPFTSLDDFLRRVKLSPADGSILVKSGALDSLAGRTQTNRQQSTTNGQQPVGTSQEPRAKGQEPFNRPQLLWFVEAWLNRNSTAQNNKKQIAMALFPYSGPSTQDSAPRTQHPAPRTQDPAPSTQDSAPRTLHPAPRTQDPAPRTQDPAPRTQDSGLSTHSRMAVTVPPLPDLSTERKRLQEIEALGFVLSVHPLTRWESVVSALPYRPVPASELGQHVGQRVWVLGWPITYKEVMTKEGEPMEFFSFEDQTAIYETVFFPKVFKRFCQELEMDRPYLLCGRVESEFGTVSLNVQTVQKLKLLSPSTLERRSGSGNQNDLDRMGYSG
jgi:error-prone DNA polymerase